MARIPETCAPVHARTLFEAQQDEAVQSLCQTVGAQLTAKLSIGALSYQLPTLFIPSWILLASAQPDIGCRCTDSLGRNGG
jgi:hypothetical protein